MSSRNRSKRARSRARSHGSDAKPESLESRMMFAEVAGTLLVEEAGGRVTDLEGRPIGLGTRSILATNGALHEPILAALAP